VRLLSEIPYEPRAIWESFHESQDRFRVVVAHRRAGKTVAFVNDLIQRAIDCKMPDPRFAYIAPFLDQAKAIVWDYMRFFADAVPKRRFHETELRVDFDNGARLRVLGAENRDALRGVYFDGVVLDEFGMMDKRAYTEVVLPALTDRGGWAVFGGTPTEKNLFFGLREKARNLEPDWRLWEFKASETGLLKPEELANARAMMDEAAYMREYECSFDAAFEGAYYAREFARAESEGRLGAVSYVETVRVTTAWDLGIDDATAIWFVQDIGRERRVIDYLEVSGEGLKDIVKRLEQKPYVYNRHVLPHDVEVKELGTGKTRIEVLRELGLRNIEVAPKLDVADGINAVRMMLSRCWFDGAKCKDGLAMIRRYRREWDDKREVWRERPYHDKASHAADAFRYLAVGRDLLGTRYQKLQIPDPGIV
jgi:hypothetical protein